MGILDVATDTPEKADLFRGFDDASRDVGIPPP
jgi:hypothetical protein